MYLWASFNNYEVMANFVSLILAPTSSTHILFWRKSQSLYNLVYSSLGIFKIVHTICVPIRIYLSDKFQNVDFLGQSRTEFYIILDNAHLFSTKIVTLSPHNSKSKHVSLYPHQNSILPKLLIFTFMWNFFIWYWIFSCTFKNSSYFFPRNLYIYLVYLSLSWLFSYGFFS